MFVTRTPSHARRPYVSLSIDSNDVVLSFYYCFWNVKMYGFCALTVCGRFLPARWIVLRWSFSFRDIDGFLERQSAVVCRLGNRTRAPNSLTPRGVPRSWPTVTEIQTKRVKNHKCDSYYYYYTEWYNC